MQPLSRSAALGSRRDVLRRLKNVKAMRKASRRFPSDILAFLQSSKILALRAGTRPHRFIGVWFVMVRGRVFVRSWTIKPQGWYHTFLEEPHGLIRIAGREMRVRARKARGERLLEAIDLGYREKYPTPGSRKYVEGFTRARRRATTTELLPW